MPTSGNKPQIVFMGSGPVAEASLRSLIKQFTIEAVITKPATKDIMASIAPAVHTAASRAELDDLLAQQHFTSQLGVIVDYGVIVSQKVINAFPLGIINSHFSLLPRWRGADPISFAILEGDTKTGVSLMMIEPTLDTGKILVQKSLPIDPTDTTPTLTKKLIVLSNKLLAEYIPQYLSGEVTARNQPHSDRATHSRKLTKQDGVIDWNKPAEQIEREIRAFTDWPNSRAFIGGKEVILAKAEAIGDRLQVTDVGKAFMTEQKELAVQTGNGLLVIERIKPVGKNEMDSASFMRGYMRS